MKRLLNAKWWSGRRRRAKALCRVNDELQALRARCGGYWLALVCTPKGEFNAKAVGGVLGMSIRIGRYEKYQRKLEAL